jgi:hypothetical protein
MAAAYGQTAQVFMQISWMNGTNDATKTGA